MKREKMETQKKRKSYGERSSKEEVRGDLYGTQVKKRWQRANKLQRNRRWMSYRAAKYTVQDQGYGITSRATYYKWHDDYRPVAMPKCPQNVYKEEWEGWNIFLDVENTFDGYDRKFGVAGTWMDFWEAVKYVQGLQLGSRREYLELHRAGKIPKNIPMAPDNLVIWKDKWMGWPGFLGRNLTSEVELRQSIDKIVCICENSHYQSNVLEILYGMDGRIELEKVLFGRNELRVLKAYVLESDSRRIIDLSCSVYGTQQDHNVWMFNNVNIFLAELDTQLLMYRA